MNAPQVQSTGQRITIEGRLSYPDIFNARPGAKQADGSVSKPKYGCHIIFEPTSEAATKVKAAITSQVTAKWGAQGMSFLGAMESSKKCLRNGNLNIDKSGVVRLGYQGMMFVVSRNKNKPMVIADKFNDGRPVHLHEDGSAWQQNRQTGAWEPCAVPWKVTVPYGGCYVNAQIEIYAMDGQPPQGKSVNASLLAIQFLRDGTAFGGSRADESDFSDVSSGSGMDPTGDPFAGATTAAAPAADPFGM